MSEIVFAIRNEKGEYATYGNHEFCVNLRFARLYKSKKTALDNYFNRKGNYENLKLVKIKIEEISEEDIKPSEFKENR